MVSQVSAKNVLEAVKSFGREYPKASKVALVATALLAGLAITAGVLAGMDHPLNLNGFNISLEGLEGFFAGTGALSLVVGGIALKAMHSLNKQGEGKDAVVDFSKNEMSGDMFPTPGLKERSTAVLSALQADRDVVDPTLGFTEHSTVALSALQKDRDVVNPSLDSTTAPSSGEETSTELSSSKDLKESSGDMKKRTDEIMILHPRANDINAVSIGYHKLNNLFSHLLPVWNKETNDLVFKTRASAQSNQTTSILGKDSKSEERGMNGRMILHPTANDIDIVSVVYTKLNNLFLYLLPFFNKETNNLVFNKEASVQSNQTTSIIGKDSKSEERGMNRAPFWSSRANGSVVGGSAVDRALSRVMEWQELNKPRQNQNKTGAGSSSATTPFSVL